MHGVRGGARGLLVLTALWSAVGVVVALPAAPAVGAQHCQIVKGRLSMSPGLTDVPSGQSVTLVAKVTGCSRSGGSGIFAAVTQTSNATCANLTTSLAATNATIAWANGRASSIAMSFFALPASPNRLVLSGTVVSGAAVGDHVDGGLHLDANFTRIVQHPPDNSHHDPTQTQLKQRAPLNSDDGSCTVAHPLDNIQVASFESLKFASSAPTTPTSAASGSQTTGTGPGSSSTTTTTTKPVVKKAAHPFLGAARPRVKHVAAKPLAANQAAGPNVSSGGSLDSSSVLLIGCIVASICLLALLLMPSKRRRRTRYVR